MILPIQFFTLAIHQSKPKALRSNPTYEIPVFLAVFLVALFKGGYQRLYVLHGGIKIFTGNRPENEGPQFRSGYE